MLTLDTDRADALTEKYNRIFRMYGCKYRLVSGKAIPVVNDLEIKEISKAMNTGVDATDTAYSEAISLLSDCFCSTTTRQPKNPRNSKKYHSTDTTYE